MKNNRPWTFLFRVDYGHKFFVHEDGRYAAADDSGSNPDWTDSGAVFLDTTLPVIVGISPISGRVRYLCLLAVELDATSQRQLNFCYT